MAKVRLIFSALVALATLGCSSTMKLTVRNADTGAPVAGMGITRKIQPSFIQKIINPIAAEYGPFELVDFKETDLQGEAIFTNATLRDMYVFYVNAPMKLDVSLRGRSVRLEPEPWQVSRGEFSGKWQYCIWHLERTKMSTGSGPDREKVQKTGAGDGESAVVPESPARPERSGGPLDAARGRDAGK